MDDPGKIERRPDGSVDTDHYRAIARQLRSETARHWLRELIGVLRRRRASLSTGVSAAGDGQP